MEIYAISFLFFFSSLRNQKEHLSILSKSLLQYEIRVARGWTSNFASSHLIFILGYRRARVCKYIYNRSSVNY